VVLPNASRAKSPKCAVTYIPFAALICDHRAWHSCRQTEQAAHSIGRFGPKLGRSLAPNACALPLYCGVIDPSHVNQRHE